MIAVETNLLYTAFSKKRIYYMKHVFILVLLFNIFFLLPGCNTVPSQNILGSYFPAWMLCAFIGILLAIIFHVIFIRIGVDEFIPGKLMVYTGLAFSLTFLVWLIRFGN